MYYVSLMEVVKKYNSVKEELKKLKGDHYSLIVNLQLMQKELEQVRGEMTQKNLVIENAQKEAKKRSLGGQG